MEELLREVTKNFLLGAFEPNPIVFTSRHEQDLERLTRAIGRSGDGPIGLLKSPVNRNSFLLACHDVTTDEAIEHLIVGYGFKHGTTTKIEGIHHVVGEEHHVRPTPAVWNAIWKYTHELPRGEVLIFHNHCRNFLHVLIDNLPLASSTDRHLSEKLKFNPFQLIKTLFGTGEVRFYVGENGFVKEFKLPPFDRIIELCNRVSDERSE
jgi:hypothetical protein